MRIDTDILFLCDHKRCNILNCGECKHTTDINHAVNGEAYKKDPLRFLNLYCKPDIQITTDDGCVRINYFESEENTYV